MTLIFNSDGSTKSAGDESFKEYVRTVFETEGILDLDDFDPDDHAQIRRWLKVWRSDDE